VKGMLSAVTLAATFLGTASAFAQTSVSAESSVPAQSSVPTQSNASSQNSHASSDADETDLATGQQQDGLPKMAMPDAPKPRGDEAEHQIPQSHEANPSPAADVMADCAVVAPPTLLADEMAWSGPCADGLAEGAGTVALSSHGQFAQSFTGTFNKGALRDGHVVIRWADGSHYEGDAVGAAMQGIGTLATAAGDKFEGEWKSGKLDGKGTAVWANGDRYTGQWRDGKAEGQGVQDWADGRQYSGQWHNDLPNGHGIIRRKDGSRFEGDFADGEPGKVVQLAVAASADAPVAVAQPVTKVPDKPNDTKGTVVADSVAAPPIAQHGAMSGIAGKKLVAVDGSSLTLTTVEDGLTREIVAPNGSVKKNTFSFLGERVGSVSDGDDADDVTGVFRLTDKGIITNYSDGRSEQLYPNAAGGVSMTLNAPTGQTFCMAWYPEGHHFSLGERKAALAAYANKLGLDESPKKSKTGLKSVCAPLADAVPPAYPSADHEPASLPEIKPVPRPAPRETRRQPLHRDASSAAKIETASYAISSADISQPRQIEVHPSIVHLIDADKPQDASLASLGPSNAPGAGASQCLSVESDGRHWAFRNHCAYDVQFAYCLMSAHDALAACDKGGIAGSVAPNSVSALVLDRSLTENNADHDFRWVACSGGAGEVVVHLDQSNPPSGRCVRRSAS